MWLTDILLWIDYGFLYFGISKYLQQKNFEISAIIDGMSSTKKFFKTQQLINFQKIWNFENIYTSLLLLPLAPLGVYFGAYLVDKIGQDWFYKIGYFCTLLAGCKLFYDGSIRLFL